MKPSILVRALASLAVLMALFTGPSLAYAGRGARVIAATSAKVNAASVSAQAKLQRAALGGRSVGTNVAWGLGLGVVAVHGLFHGDIAAAGLFGGFSAYNTVQAVRKWKAESKITE